MNLDILCSSADHPVNEHLKLWINKHKKNHSIGLCRQQADLRGGDILFLVSCSELIDKNTREKYSHTLVIHASNLPQGRGWNPLIWQILEGKEEIKVSLLEAEDAVDSGAIWHKVTLKIPKSALWDEINRSLFDAELELMDYALNVTEGFQPQSQKSHKPASYYRKRTPDDSELKPELSIRSQFDLMRVCDPDRYPAYFELYGQRYKIRLEKMIND